MKYIQQYKKIFAKIEQVKSDTSLSQRVRILLINLIEERASGWSKSKKQNESGPKKIEDLRKELEQKHKDEEQKRIEAEYEEQ